MAADEKNLPLFQVQGQEGKILEARLLFFVFIETLESNVRWLSPKLLMIFLEFNLFIL